MHLTNHSPTSSRRSLTNSPATERRLSREEKRLSYEEKRLSVGSTPIASEHFHCEDHDEVESFKLKELRTQVFDTYAICAALLTGLSASRFFFDNRDPHEFLYGGHGWHAKVHLSFLLQHIHLLIACICTAAGLESMLVFVLCAMYSRSALAMPQVGAKVFEYFLKQTGGQRHSAFLFLIGSGILSSFNVVINCLTMPTFIMRTKVPACILDVCAMICASLIFFIAVTTVREVGKILGAAAIIFVPQDKLDEFVMEKEPLLQDCEKGSTKTPEPNYGAQSQTGNLWLKQASSETPVDKLAVDKPPVAKVE